MDKKEANELLVAHLAAYRERSYTELVSLERAGATTVEVTGRSGTRYQIEMQVFWDGPRGGDVRVTGSIDDGGWRSFAPLSADFIMAPDGSFVGEESQGKNGASKANVRCS